MKKIIAALAIASLAFGAQAQQTKQVCRKSSTGDLSCYKTKYAQNFSICKDNFGYKVCGEPRNYKNSTNPGMAVAAATDQSQMQYAYEAQGSFYGEMPAQATPTPQSQSYATYQENATVPYGASYSTRRGDVKYCYFGDNVAELNRNPYKGCPTPQNDGLEQTKARAWSNGN